FNHINFNKTLLDITVDESGSTLDLAPFDVVVTNLSPHRAAAVGVDADAALATGGPLLQIASSGFGLTGELTGYRAYGTNIHAFAGLVAATRDSKGEMSSVGTPWADPLTSVALCAWILAWSLSRGPSASTAVDMSMAEVLA